MHAYFSHAVAAYSDLSDAKSDDDDDDDKSDNELVGHLAIYCPGKNEVHNEACINDHADHLAEKRIPKDTANGEQLCVPC